MARFFEKTAGKDVAKGPGKSYNTVSVRADPKKGGIRLDQRFYDAVLASPVIAAVKDMEQLEDYEKWFAYYNAPVYFPYDFSIWQYSSKGSVRGIDEDVDLNICMKDFVKKD